VVRICAVLITAGVAATSLIAQSGGASKSYKGLEITASAIERAPRVSLKDCPPGANTVGSTAKPGEEFAVVTLNIKVLPGYKPVTLKRPVITDASGKTYNTAVSFVDIGSVPEFSCAIPFRVPQGTKVKSVQVDEVSLDLTALDK
jgi:hypothetical protein